jgi:lysophospholipase L1-like esterase
MPQEHAEILIGQLTELPRRIQFDPLTWIWPRGAESKEIPFAQYPGGRWVKRTHSLGLRDDDEPAAEQSDLRILVAGDSHTDGQCSNADSCVALLEARLAALDPGNDVEGLNAGHSGFHFYSYLGTLEIFEFLRPDVFVALVYGGNDFIEILFAGHYVRATAMEYDGTKCEQMFKDRGYPSGALSQALRQVDAPLRHPHGLELALYVARLTTQAMADRWIADAAEAGVTVLDLRPALRASTVPLDWREDHHINLEGNAVVAREFASRIAADHAW